MDVGKLKTLRVVVPGTIILIEAYPIYASVYGKTLWQLLSSDLLITGFGSVVAYILGAIYNIFCIRAIFNGQSHKKIINNIKNRILDMGRTLPLTPERRSELLSGNEIIDIFYALVDSNKTLTERSKLVRDNGLKWSSVADIIVLGTFFGFLYMIIGLVLNNKLMLEFSEYSLLTIILFWFLHPIVEKKHIALSNSQLDFIGNQLRNELIQRVDDL